MKFSQFCTCTPSGYAQLKRCVDYCADRGHSYEFSACRLPAGCWPGQVQVGFWRDRGEYLLYLRPKVRYQGSAPALEDFFAQSELLRFPSFQAMAACLQALPKEA